MSTRWMTVADVCEDLGISYDTWAKWRAKGRAPQAKRLPNGELRIARADYDAWLEQLEAA